MEKIADSKYLRSAGRKVTVPFWPQLEYKGQPVLLFFHMAGGWPPCLQQIVDLQNDPTFQALDVAILSVAFDPQQEQAASKLEYGISAPMLVDIDHSVSETYDVLQWAVGTGEPGHTFVLVNADGEISWIQDYGAPENGGLMYVPVDELTAKITFNAPWSFLGMTFEKGDAFPLADLFPYLTDGYVDNAIDPEGFRELLKDKIIDALNEDDDFWRERSEPDMDYAYEAKKERRYFL